MLNFFSRRSKHDTPRRSAPRRLAPIASEVLEERTLLSASYALTTDQLLLSNFTEVSAEAVTIRDTATHYEFVLSEGTWSGDVTAGISGAGTAVLSVEKSAVAGLAGGIEVHTRTTADIEATFLSADFSTLSGRLTIVSAVAIQTAGTSLIVDGLGVSAEQDRSRF